MFYALKMVQLGIVQCTAGCVVIPTSGKGSVLKYGAASSSSSGSIAAELLPLPNANKCQGKEGSQFWLLKERQVRLVSNRLKAIVHLKRKTCFCMVCYCNNAMWCICMVPVPVHAM
ncbi:TPA: hypothetical protein ACH3X1_007598 [Trebouxia sp. C0004]